MGEDAGAEARVGLAGPVLGSIATLIPLGIYLATGEDFWRALAYVGFFLNLFNLLPVLPLDGGRAMAALSPTHLAGRLRDARRRSPFVFPNPIMILILLFGGCETYRRWKDRGTRPEAQAFHCDPEAHPGPRRGRLPRPRGAARARRQRDVLRAQLLRRLGLSAEARRVYGHRCMAEREFDAIVIGAGPAGEVIAGRLADGDLDVAIVEQHLVGGECSFYACMPSKALLRPAALLAEVKRVPGLPRRHGRRPRRGARSSRAATRSSTTTTTAGSSPGSRSRGIELVPRRGQARRRAPGASSATTC